MFSAAGVCVDTGAAGGAGYGTGDVRERAERIVVLVTQPGVDLEPLRELQSIEHVRGLVLDLAVRLLRHDEVHGPRIEVVGVRDAHRRQNRIRRGAERIAQAVTVVAVVGLVRQREARHERVLHPARRKLDA